MNGEAVATANGIAKINPAVPISANPTSFGAIACAFWKADTAS